MAPKEAFCQRQCLSMVLPGQGGRRLQHELAQRRNKSSVQLVDDRIAYGLLTQHVFTRIE